MSQQRTVQLFFQNSVLRYAGLGLALLIIASLGISFLLARKQAESELQESARATVQAFSDRILDGDIKSVEPQIRQLLKIQKNEIAKILKSDLTRVYEPFNEVAPSVMQCPLAEKACLEGFFGQAHILFPISLDPSGKNPYRYLYLSKDVHLNWYFLLTIFTIFVVGYFGLIMAFIRISKIASQNLGKEILNWSERLLSNPKDLTPLSEPPFSELLPLKYAIEGLNDQIEKFEQTATDRAKFLILRGIGHDLLTPVSRLQLYLATLEKNIDREQNADTLSEMKDSLKRVTTFASQVKTLKESPSPEESTELVSVLTEEVKHLQALDQISEKSISLEFNCRDSAIHSPFSKAEISRILLNLVQNAADASVEGSLVSIDAGISDGKSYFSVSDSGCGISEEFKGRVFDPDFTLKPGTGTGLGLAIVKYLCDQRKASIELETKSDRGTKIKICSPAIIGGIHV